MAFYVMLHLQNGPKIHLAPLLIPMHSI